MNKLIFKFHLDSFVFIWLIIKIKNDNFWRVEYENKSKKQKKLEMESWAFL